MNGRSQSFDLTLNNMKDQVMHETEPSHDIQVKRVWEPLLTPIEAAELLRIHPKTALRLARTHGIPAIRLGKHWRFRTCDLRAWAETQIQPCIEPSEALV
jgi:excisionase family DNA binding protein